MNINDNFMRNVHMENLIMIKESLNCGADIHFRNDWALQYSICNCKIEISTLLLENGANVHSGDDFCLTHSARLGDFKTIALLLKYGANVHACDDVALRISCANNRPAIVEILLKYGANVHARDDAALRISCANDRLKIVELLLEHGANIWCNNREILINLSKVFNEGLADLLLPYCEVTDYEYFPHAYVKRKIVPTKSANKN